MGLDGFIDNLAGSEPVKEQARDEDNGQFVPDLPAEAELVEKEHDDLLERLDSEEEEVGIEVTPIDENAETPDMVAGVEKDAIEAEEKAEAQPTESDKIEGTTDDLARALSALKRDGIPQTLIDKMSNEEIVNLGDKRLKVQGDTDETYRKLAELTKSDDMASENATEATEDVTPTPPTSPTQSINLKEAVAPFSELFGEDAASALEKYTAAAVNDSDARLQQMEQTNQALSSALEVLMVDRSRAKLGDQYPQLSSEESFNQVQERMKSLVKSGDYKDIDSLMSDAARIEFANYASSAAASLRQQRNQMKEQGQMAPTSTPPSDKGLTSEEAEDQLLDLLESGVSINDSKQRLGI